MLTITIPEYRELLGDNGEYRKALLHSDPKVAWKEGVLVPLCEIDAPDDMVFSLGYFSFLFAN